MRALRLLYDGFRLWAGTLFIPLFRNITDRATGEVFLNEQSYDRAYGIYRMTARHAKKHNLVFDELKSLLTLNEVLDYYSLNDNEAERIYERLFEIESLFDNQDAVCWASIADAYAYTPANTFVGSKIAAILDSYYIWFINQSKKYTANLKYREAIICAKAARRSCVLFQPLSYDRDIESLFSLGVIYGNCFNAGLALSYYDEAISIAKLHEDNAYLFVAISRKLTILLEFSHLGTDFDYDNERDSLLSLLLDTIGYSTLKDYAARLIEAEQLNDTGIYRDNLISKIEEALANLELLLTIKSGDIKSARDCVERINDAELQAYGESGHAEAIIDNYQMLYDSPERVYNQQEEPTTDDPHCVPDIPSDYPLSFRFQELLKWMTNCTVNNWHDSAQDTGACLFALSVEADSDYHICMANHMIARDLAYSGKEKEALQLYNGTLSILLQGSNRLESDANLSPYLYYAICMSVADILLTDNSSEAIDYYDKALSYLGRENSNHLLLEINLRTSRAIAYKAIGQIDCAEKEFNWCLCSLTQTAIDRLPFLTGDERESLWNKILVAIKRILANLKNDSGSDFRRTAYNAVLFSKGFLLTTETSIQKIVSESDMQRALELYRISVKQNTEVGAWGTSHTFKPHQYVEKYLNDIRLRIEIKDALSELSIGQHDSFESISSSLHQGAVLVDYFDTVTDPQDNNPRYLAFIIKPGQDTPDVIDVFSEDMLSGIISQMKSDGIKNESALYDSSKSYGSSLFKTIWEPISEQLFGCETVYFCPSGSLNKISIECLPYDSKIIADSYPRLYRVSHAREVLSLVNDTSDAKDTAVLIGGLTYDADSHEYTTEGDKPESRGNYVGNSTIKDDETTLCPWQYLPWTSREVDMFQSLWMRTPGKQVSVFKGHDCNLHVLEGLAQSKTDILHIATHGFSETQQTARDIPALSDTFNPLQLTGLILSDGNRGWLYGNKYNHPGVLTAYDISCLNLQGIALVVLSACFTGGGTIGDDGLYGLVRAFKKAGVKTVIASLWEQTDQVGFLFMYYFYLSYLRGTDCRDAFKNARNRVRSDYSDPLYWAGYILID